MCACLVSFSFFLHSSALDGMAALQAGTGISTSMSVVASAISTLPLDVGTVISPTLGKPSVDLDSSTCNGGPGNATCGLDVKDDQQGVQCDICGRWSHAICQNVTKAAYNALSKHNTLAFICDACRRRPNLGKIQPKPVMKEASVQTSLSGLQQVTSNISEQSEGPMHTLTKDSGALSQCIAPVQSLEASIKDHAILLSEYNKTRNTQAHEQGGNSGHHRPTFAEVLRGPTPTHYTQGSATRADPRPAPRAGSDDNRGHQTYTDTGRHQNNTSNDYRSIVRAELREMEERKKRVASLVVRGLRVGSAGEAAAKFSDIAFAITGERVTLTEVCRIRSDADLFRGNIHDSRHRKLILEQSKYLRDSEHSHVFIRRDLTFLQREELRARYPLGLIARISRPREVLKLLPNTASPIVRHRLDQEALA